MELDEEKIKEYYNKITSGEVTLIQAADNEDINRETLRDLITKQIGDDENRKKDFFERLHQNKSKNNFIEINDTIMENVKLYILGNISIQDACKKCNINKETFNSKVFSVLSKNPGLLELYLRNGSNKKDYSQVNTRLIIINMLRNDLSQSDISRELGIPVRTISGWVNKLPVEDELRIWAKEAVNRTRHCIKLSQTQLGILNSKLDKYVQDNNIQQQPLDTRSIEERELEKVEKFLEKVYELESEKNEKGKKKYTRKQIMDKLGVGYSAIRRAEIKRDKLKLIIDNRGNKEVKGE